MSMPRFTSGASSRIGISARTASQRHDLKLSSLFLTPGRCSPLHSAAFLCPSRDLRRGGGGPIKKEHGAIWTVTLSRSLEYTLFSRYASTNPPQPPKETRSHDERPPPTPAGPAPSKQKPKIELRPGPVKPGSSTSPSSTMRRTTSEAPQQQQQVSPQQQKAQPITSPPLSAVSKKEEVLEEPEKTSLIEMAKKDVQDAAAHGILKPPPPDASWARKLFHQAKELFKFYIAGLKFIVRNRKEANQILERVRSEGAPLTWREHRFIATNKADIVKLGPFVLTLVIIEEIVPLIVIYAPGMLPSTCILPSQRTRITAKRHERQRGAYTLSKDLDVFQEVDYSSIRLSSLTNYQVKLLCSTMGISSTGPAVMLRWRLSRRLSALAEEDALLLAEGKGARLTRAEIEQVLWERGFLADCYDPNLQREHLRWWISNACGSDAEEPSASVDERVRLLVYMHQQCQ